MFKKNFRTFEYRSNQDDFYSHGDPAIVNDDFE